MRRALFLALALCGPSALAAQSDWRTVQQQALWVSAFVDHALDARTALWFDGHWRRMGFGEEPQQVLLRPGVQWTLAPGLRVAAGYAYVATAPYGESPNLRPTREDRLWQQVSFSQTAGRTTLSQRLRWEERWIAPVASDGSRGPRRFQQRLRVQARVQRPVGSRLLGYASNELFVPFGHSDGDQRRLQNRAQVGVGIPIDSRQRLEIGYMHQWNRITPRTTHDINHTVVVAWLWTQRR